MKPVYWAVLAAAVLAVAATHACWVGLTERRVQSWERDRAALLAIGREQDQRAVEAAVARAVERARADSLEIVARQALTNVSRATDDAARWQRRAAVYRDSLSRSPDSVRVLVAIVEAQDSALHALSAENDSLRDAVAAQMAASVRLRSLVASHEQQFSRDSARIKELESLVRSAPTSRSNKLLGLIPLPSRTVSFVAGGVVGAYLATR